MPEEVVQNTESEEVEAPEAEAEDPEVQRAREDLEKLRTKLGPRRRDREKAEAAPAEAADEGETDEEPKKEAAPKEEKPSAQEVAQRYKERQRKREEEQRELERLRQQNEQYQRLLQQALGEPEQESWQPPKDVAFEEDPQQWYRQEMQKELAKALGPIYEQRQIEEQRQRQAQQMAMQQAQAAAWLQSLQQAETEYEQTREGEGYKERVTRYVQARAQQRLQETGDQNLAAELTIREIGALVKTAQELGEHPAYYVDSMIRQSPLIQQQNGQPQKPKEKKPGRIAELKKAASAPEAGSLAQGGEAEVREGAEARRMVRRGTVGPKDLRKLVDERTRKEGIPWRRALQEEMRKIEQLADREAS